MIAPLVRLNAPIYLPWKLGKQTTIEQILINNFLAQHIPAGLCIPYGMVAPIVNIKYLSELNGFCASENIISRHSAGIVIHNYFFCNSSMRYFSFNHLDKELSLRSENASLTTITYNLGSVNIFRVKIYLRKDISFIKDLYYFSGYGMKFYI